MFSSLGENRLEYKLSISLLYAKRAWILKPKSYYSLISQRTDGRLSADDRRIIGRWRKKIVVDKINQARFVFIVTAKVSRLKPHLSADQHEKI